MDIFLIILGSLLILTGLVGCVVPVLPGPPISYLGILCLHFTTIHTYSAFALIILAALAAIVTVLDYLVPIWGTKKAGGSKWGVRGAAIGLIIGLLFGGTLGNFIIPILAPLVGIIVGPFLGALIGELLYHSQQKQGNQGDNFNKSLKAAFGSFLGLMFGTVLKLMVSSLFAFLFIKDIIKALV
jgi:uncharacterized protein